MKRISIALCMMGFTISAMAQIFLSKDFNTGALNQGVFNTPCVTYRNPGFLTDSFATDGGFDFYASVSKTDSVCGGSHRTEINTTIVTFATAEWMYWETYQPAWQPNDPVPFSSGQIHGSVNVPFYIRFINSNVDAVIQNSATNNSSLTTNAIYPLGYFAKGVWHKWLIHFKRSAFSDGFLEMWADREFMFRYDGPTADLIAGATETAWYAKFGIYKWNIMSSAYGSAVSVTNNIKLGGASSTYYDFFPAPSSDPSNKFILTNIYPVKEP